MKTLEDKVYEWYKQGFTAIEIQQKLRGLQLNVSFIEVKILFNKARLKDG